VNDSYRALLGRPVARGVFLAISAAWLSYGILTLALFLVVHRATGSSAVAGAAVGAFSFGSALSAPLRGRILDRRGVRPWLLIFAIGYGSMLTLLALAARFEPRAWLLLLCAAAAGLSVPPLIAVLRNLWSSVVEDSLLRRAYAVTALLGDVGAVVPPMLAGLIFVLSPSTPLLIAAAAALIAAAIATVLSSATEPTRDTTAHAEARDRLAGSRPMRALLGVSVALGAAFGLVQVAIPAAAIRWGHPGYSGLLLGAFALGSVAGGLWYGRRRWQRPPEQRYLFAVLVLALALAPTLAATNAVTLAPLLILAGLGSGPATISLFEALDLIAPKRGTEALTWITTAEAIGTAAGAAASGWASTSIGTWTPFAAGSTLLAVAATAALLWLRTTTAAKTSGSP
jgi:MFS family permease